LSRQSAIGLRGRPRLDRALTAKTGPQTALKMKRSARLKSLIWECAEDSARWVIFRVVFAAA
jgi:hypothetical protein